MPPLESVEKVDTLLDGNAVRSKIKDFRTALYPRQYHPCTLEKPLFKRLFAYKVFFRRTCRRKNKIRLTAAFNYNSAEDSIMFLFAAILLSDGESSAAAETAFSAFL